MQKKKVFLIIILVLAIIIAAVSLSVFKKSGKNTASKIEEKDKLSEQSDNSQPVSTPTWQKYSNEQILFSVEYPGDWMYLSRSDSDNSSSGIIMKAEGNGKILEAENPSSEISNIKGDYFELESLIMDEESFKNFDPKKYVSRSGDGSEGEVMKWEEATTNGGSPEYFFTAKIPGQEKPEEGVIFVNSNERKIVVIKSGSGVSEDLRENLKKIASTISDLEKKQENQ